MTSQTTRFILAIACVLCSMSLNAKTGFIAKTYTFKPNQPQLINNPLLWELKTECLIESKDPQNTLSGLMKRKNGRLNDTSLREGESASITIKNKETLHIVADFRAQIVVTNYGPSTVIAKCSI